jgi:hypothetical protein
VLGTDVKITNEILESALGGADNLKATPRKGFLMAVIRATCGQCGDIEMTPADVWVRVRKPSRQATYSFRCPACGGVETKEASSHVVHLLEASGVRVWDAPPPKELVERRPMGPPFTHSDMLAFAALLEGDAWYEQLLSQMGRS